MTNLVKNLFAAFILIAGISTAALAASDLAKLSDGDKYESLAWPQLKKEFLTGGKVEFDERVVVTGPDFAEDAMNVPVKFDASKLEKIGGGIDQIVVLVDRNPIKKVLVFEPNKVKAILSFRFKLEQSSPIRVAVQTKDKVWHVGHTWVEASGGGCTVNGASRNDGSWSKTLNQVSTRFFLSKNGDNIRLRTRVMHPMDTGLVAGVPAFHLEDLVLLDGQDKTWMRLQTFEPVSENPLFSFDLPKNTPIERLRLVGRDNNGNKLSSAIQ
uniref:quinoprotein dehydrogenase-associated SoxYZ-like carrier n=1 Tax=Polynucleobacter sp. TaxID=2029855 RepID=UPI004047F33D